MPQVNTGLLLRIRNAVLRHGFLLAVIKAADVLFAQLARAAAKTAFRRKHNRMMEELERRVASHQGFIDVFPKPVGWSSFLFQRFQHFSLQAARLGGLALYGGLPPRIDRNLWVYREVEKNLIVFDATERWITARLFKALEAVSVPRILRVISVDTVTTLEEIEEAANKGFKVIYEYIDELSADILGEVPDMIRRRHEAILLNEEIPVVATSDRIYKTVSQYRSRNFILSTNGVDVAHWRISKAPPPKDLQRVLGKGTIVAYHGALAQWLDYDLLRKIANENGFTLVLIGQEHDASFSQSGLKTHPRVHFLGSKSYFELNRYAAYYDIAIVPFRKTDLMDSVSPVKIFEYMAARKPIVSTNLHECSKYRSCLIAKNHEEFIQLLYQARTLADDPAYLRLLDEEAADNSWESKTREVLRLIGINP